MASLKEAMHLGVLFYPSQKFSSVFSKVFYQLTLVIILLKPFPEFRLGLCFFR